MSKYIYLFIFVSYFNTIGQAQSCWRSDAQKLISPKVGHFKNDNVLRVPVVVHIVLHDYIRTEISNAAIHKQIDALNRDFRKRNYNLNLLDQRYQDLAADTKIEFFLACYDPTGQAHEGITKRRTSIEDIGLTNALFFTHQGGTDTWPTDQYLNIWVCDMPNNILGYASSPLDEGRHDDGVVINYRYFGSNRTTPAHDMGRTLVHEIGHYLGLNHPWGNIREECSEDDGITDTPPQKGPHNECPSSENNMCSDNEQFYGNFMDYSPDCCLAMFTHQQAQRMRDNLLSFRANLLNHNLDCSETNDVTLAINIFPNPTYGSCTISWPSEQVIKNIHIYDSAGRFISTIKPAGLNDQIDFCLDQNAKGALLIHLVSQDGKVYTKRLLHL